MRGRPSPVDPALSFRYRVGAVVGLGAFVSDSVEERRKWMRKAQTVVQMAVERLRLWGATEEEIRRLFENELSAAHAEHLEGNK